MVLTFGLFLHHVESHIAVAPNNVRGKDLAAAWLCLLLLCNERNNAVTHITGRPSTAQSIHKATLLKSEDTLRSSFSRSTQNVGQVGAAQH